MSTQVEIHQDPISSTPEEQNVSNETTPVAPNLMTMAPAAAAEAQHEAHDMPAKSSDAQNIQDDNAVNAQRHAEELAKAYVLEHQVAHEDIAIVPMNGHAEAHAATPMPQSTQDNSASAAHEADDELTYPTETPAAASALNDATADADAPRSDTTPPPHHIPTALELASHRSPAEAQALAAAEERAREEAQRAAEALAKREAEEAKAKAEAEAEAEADLEERRQLCSEIVALRKELAIVKEDEANLRRQLATTACIIAEHSPSSEPELAALEAAAQHSQLHQLWEEECQQHNPDKMDWATIDIQNIAPRIAAAKQDFEASQERITSMFANLEKEINGHTDYRDEMKNKMKQAFDEELAATGDVRARLRQVDEEQKFHHRRGTTRRGAANVVPEEKTTLSRQRRIATAEVNTTAKVDKLTSELSDLMSQCKVLKQRFDNTRTLQSKKEEELNALLTATQDGGQATRQIKEKLVKEQEELAELKTDLQGVLHYVRAKQREEEEIL